LLLLKPYSVSSVIGIHDFYLCLYIYSVKKNINYISFISCSINGLYMFFLSANYYCCSLHRNLRR